VLGLLVAIGTVSAHAVNEALVLGKLSLHGGIETVSGVLPAAMAAVSAGMDLICPRPCGPEAVWANDLGIVAAPDLMALLTIFAVFRFSRRRRRSFFPQRIRRSTCLT